MVVDLGYPSDDAVPVAVGNDYKLSASSTVIRDERYESNVCV